MLRNFYKYLPVVWLVLLGCGEDEGTRQPSDAAFFPLRKGFYQIYEVRETNYLRIDESETFLYQLKTEVVDSFVNQQGGYTYTLHRSKRNSVSDPWEVLNLWSVRLTTANVVVSQENVPIVKIAFPPVKNRQWDGNALNSESADEYEITMTGKSYPLESNPVSGDYIQIIQEDSGDIFNVNQRKEVYVRNIGLVLRTVTDLEYCSDADDCDITAQVIDNGTVYVQTLVEYGQN